MHRTPSPTAAFWLAAFTYFIWGFTFLASRVAQNYGSPFVLLFWRFALAFVLMNLLCLTGRFHVHLHGRDLRPVLLAGLFEPVLYFPCEQYGLKLTSTSFSGVMIALIPLCSLIYGALFLHEKATRRQVLFSVLSVAGVIVLAVYASGIGSGSVLGFFILLGTVFAGAAYMVASRACSDSFSAFERTYVTCLMGTAAFGVLSLLEHRHRSERRRAAMTHAPFVLAIVFLMRGGLGAVLHRAQPRTRGAARRAHRSAHQSLDRRVRTHRRAHFARAVRLISAVASAAILVGIWGVQRFAAPTPSPAAGGEPLPPS